MMAAAEQIPDAELGVDGHEVWVWGAHPRIARPEWVPCRERSARHRELRSHAGTTGEKHPENPTGAEFQTLSFFPVPAAELSTGLASRRSQSCDHEGMHRRKAMWLPRSAVHPSPSRSAAWPPEENFPREKYSHTRYRFVRHSRTRLAATRRDAARAGAFDPTSRETDIPSRTYPRRHR